MTSSDTSTDRRLTRPQSRRPAGGPKAPQSTGPRKEFTDAEIAEANTKLHEAFVIGGFGGDPLTCPNPSCRTNERKKVEFKTSGTSGAPYWKCFKCGTNSAAVKVLTEYAGIPFRQAVRMLLGRDTSVVDVKTLPPVVIEPAFQAVVDVAVYDAIRAAGSVEAAQWYWGTWHIDPAIVADSGSTMLTDPAVVRDLLREPTTSAKFAAAWKAHRAAVARIHSGLVEQFGWDRLRDAGVVMQVDGRDGGKRDHFLVNADYPVIEVHEARTGHVVGMQFRPVGRVKEKIDTHKAWKKRWQAEARRRWPDDPEKSASAAWEAAYAEDPQAAGDKHGYEHPFFLSIRGAGTDSLVGCGLPRIAQLPPGTRVAVIEGFKDVLATRTLGAEAYGMPGVGNMPPAKSCEVLEPHDVCVVLDGDAAGDTARADVVEYFDTTRRHVFGLKVSPTGAPRLAKVLAGTENLAELLLGVAIRSRDDGIVWVTGRLAAAGPQHVIQVISRIARVDVGRIAHEERGVRSRPVSPWASRDSTDVLVERVAHTGCPCPTCVAWRAGHDETPDNCRCAVCTQRRAGHRFAQDCTCGSCHAVRARVATEKLR